MSVVVAWQMSSHAEAAQRELKMPRATRATRAVEPAAEPRDIADAMDQYVRENAKEEFYRAALSLFFFCVRDITRVAGIMLAEKGLNRTHFRALFSIYFIPG